MTVLDLCSYLGLGAAGAIALNLLCGMLISLRYSPVRAWPHRRFNLFAAHQWTAYAAVALMLTHPGVLSFVDQPKFRTVDILWPFHSPLQPWINVAGAAALYVLLLVFVSSLLRTRIGRPLWRKLHYLVYPAAVLDGGKVFLEICTLISVAAVVVRYRLRAVGFRPVRREAARPTI
jgi:predicted ferric reductase